MFNFLTKVNEISKFKSTLDLNKDEIIEYLKLNKSELDKFEKLYQRVYNIENQDLIKMRKDDFSLKVEDDLLNFVIDNIVNSLINQTTIYDSETGSYENLKPKFTEITTDFLTEQVENGNLKQEELPQCTGIAMKIDCDRDTINTIIDTYQTYKKTNEEHFYHMFRMGLDILDLDPYIYTLLGRNKNSIGNWLPQIVNANKHLNFFKIPKTKIINVPITLLQTTRTLTYDEINPTTSEILNRYCKKVFNLEYKDYFVKTGTFSSKFNFRNARVVKDDVDELGLYLWLMSSEAVHMAHYPNPIYGVSTTNEWTVREYIEDVEGNPTIYNGLPLRCEFRLFVDFDTEEVMGISPYWRSDVMVSNFSKMNSLDASHDLITFGVNEEKLNKEYDEFKDVVISEIEKLLPLVELNGQYSIDIMKNGNDFYIIDMALASDSALSDVVKTKIEKVESFIE